MKRKTFEMDGETIEVAPEVTEEEQKMTIEEIEEIYKATEMTDDEAAKMFDVPIEEVDLADEDMEWLDKIAEEE